MTAYVLGIALVGACCAWLYTSSDDALESPAVPDWRAGALLFFDEPSVPAELKVRVTDDLDRVQYDYFIDLPEDLAQDEARYHLVLWGRARPEATFPDGSPYPRVGGCPTLSVFGLGDDLSCSAATVGAEDDFSGIRSGDSVQVITGQVVRNDAGHLFTSLTVYADGDVADSAGARTYFKLPTFGTELPEEFRAELPVRLPGEAIRAWGPSPLRIYVEYRPLDVNEHVESVAPNLVVPDQLAWLDDSAVTLEASGSILDADARAGAERRLFFIGILIGVLGGMLPALLAGLGRTLRR